MLEILKVLPDKVVKLEEVQKDCWINVQAPTDEEIARLRQVIDVPDEILSSLKDIDEIPVIEEHDKFTFIIIRTPYNHPRSDLTWVTHPLGIILNDHFVVTICYDPDDVVNKLKSTPFRFRKSQLVLRLLLTSSKLFLTYLKEIHKKMISSREELESSHRNKVIMGFLELEESLVYFDTSLKSNQILIEQLPKHERLTKFKDNHKLIYEIVEENKQAIQMTEVYSNIQSNTLDAFASIVSNNLNIAMKTLTSLTLIFSIPMLIASVYGMNVEIPYEHSPHAFTFVMALSLILSAIAVIIFTKKRFF